MQIAQSIKDNDISLNNAVSISTHHKSINVTSTKTIMK